MEDKSGTFKWYLAAVKKRLCLLIFIIVMSIIIGCTIDYYNTKKINTETEYEASVSLFLKEPEVYIGLSYSNYQSVNKSIINHFSNLLKMRLVVDEVIDNIQLNMDYEDFIRKMDVDLIENSNIINLKIRYKDPEITKKLINELITVSVKKSTEIFGFDDIQIVDDVQINAIFPKFAVKQDVIIYSVLGILIGLLIIFLLEYMDKTIKTLDDIECDLDLPLVGVIYSPFKEDKLIIYEDPDSFAAETYRNIVVNITSMQKEKGIKTIVFISPSSNKYKSAVTANVAIALGRTGQKVLLIDGDMRESNISDLFELKGEMGLSDIIDEKISLNDVIMQTRIEENLYVLPSGKTFSNPADLLALEDMNILLDMLTKAYDVILIDSPSLELVAEPIILSTITNGIILVYEERTTELEIARQGKKKLKMVNSNILGVILQAKDLNNFKYIINNS
ncbi:MAG TPA: polysaccharide biosynthesis tyrosine autokinase [Clostridiales bacterium]|nr:polysaccharide biosynthesis tyrosine autokinase [Clostridiales bacterium]